MTKAMVLGVSILLGLACPLWAADGCIADLVYIDCAQVGDGIEYSFNARAGINQVEGIHMAVLDPEGSAIEILGTSVPDGWDCQVHDFNWVHFWAEGSPYIIPACGQNGPFRLMLARGDCHIKVQWRYDPGCPFFWNWADWTCRYSAAEGTTWGSVKALYE